MTHLGEQPTPQVEPAEPAPGGVDAVADLDYEPGAVVPDVDPAAPAAEEAAYTAADRPDDADGSGDDAAAHVIDQVREPDRTDQGASSDGASHPEQEAPA